MKLTPEEVRKIARLARLELSNAEVATYQDQLGEVLTYVEQLNEVDVAAVPITAQVTGLSTVLADDVVADSLPRDAVLRNAPAQQNGSIKVKSVFGDRS